MERRDVTPSERTDAGGPTPEPALAALFECEADLDALERVLLALAVHPDGAAARAAWLVRWSPARGVLEGRRHALAAEPPGRLAETLGRARRAAPESGDGARRLRAWSEEPARLEGAPSAAWRGASGALGAGGEQPGAPWSAAPRVAAVLLRRDARPFGLLVVEPAAADGDDVVAARLEAVRTLGEAALTVNARAAEAKSRARQAAALAAFARGCVASVNVAEAMHLLARLAAQGAGLPGAAVFLAGPGGTAKLEVAHGPAAWREAAARALEPEAREALASRRPRGTEPGAAGPAAAWAVVPLLAYERALGAVAVHDAGEEPREGLAPHDLEFLAALAAQAALLLAHAQAVDELARAHAAARDQSARLRELDRLAGLGELAARVAEEARNPIAAIAAFARRAHRALEEGDPQNEYLEIVVRETERLEAMLAEQLEYARLERPRLRMQALNDVVQGALQRAGETLVRRRVRLVKKLAPDLPALLLDAARIQRVVENVLAYALETVPVGGRLQVESRRAGGFVLVEFAFDGQRQGGDLLEQLFVPFATGAAGGAAVGLGLAQQIVREHGGEVRVRGESEWNTVFSFTLPVAGNEDRRRRRERRSARGERRRSDGPPGAGGV